VKPDLQLWAITRGSDVVLMAWTCAEHAPEAGDPVFPLLGLRLVRVTSRKWLKLMRANHCIDCTLESGRRVVAVDTGAIGDIQAADVAGPGEDA